MSDDAALLRWFDEIVSSSFTQGMLNSSHQSSTNGVSVL